VGSSQRIVSVSALLVVLAAGAGAQEQESTVNRGFGLRLQGGGYSPLAHLDNAETIDWKTGFNIGGGAAYQFNKYWAVRGNFTWGRAEARDKGPGTISQIDGVKFNRFIYDGDVQFRYPFRSGIAPYVFAGGGAVTTKPHNTDNTDSFTKGAGKFGLGVHYQIPRSRAALYVESATWVYKWKQYGFDRTQYDITWNGGVSYTF